jgi:hypothetical protein
LKRLLNACHRNGPTSGPVPLLLCDDDDDDDRYIIVVALIDTVQ